MTGRNIRILMAKLGIGYDLSMVKLAEAFCEAGIDIVHLESQDPKTIANMAIHKSVDHIGLTVVPGADLGFFSSLFKLLSEKNASDIRVSVGGFLSDQESRLITSLGVTKVFPMGTTYEQLIEWSKENIKPTDTSTPEENEDARNPVAVPSISGHVCSMINIDRQSYEELLGKLGALRRELQAKEKDLSEARSRIAELEAALHEPKKEHEHA